MVRTHARGRSERHGTYTAVEGKLAPDDSRAAYVENGLGQPIASFWTYGEAVRYAKERAKPLAYGDRCRAVLPKERESNPFELTRYAYGTIRHLGSHHAIVLWDDPEHAALLPKRHGLDSLYRLGDNDLDPREKQKEVDE